MQTTDLSDKYGEKVRVADSIFNNYGYNIRFFGAIHTLKVFEDNSLKNGINFHKKITSDRTFGTPLSR